MKQILHVITIFTGLCHLPHTGVRIDFIPDNVMSDMFFVMQGIFLFREIWHSAPCNCSIDI
jgi:hypothetical protein